MSSTRSVLSAKPRVRVAPRAASSDAEDASFLASGYGLQPDDWQDDVLDDWLGRRADGRWSAATCGLAVARQNGKNGVIEIRELFGIIALGERFLHTAHEVKTARKAFLRIASFFENERQYPELAALVKDIRKTNGQEAVLLTNGGGVEFIARSKGSGRGFTVDVLVLDEAQDLTDEELAALLPTISAAPTANPQVILTGTPPDPDKGQQGEVFSRVRADGQLRRDKRLAWTDFGVADGSCPDVDDRDLWLRTNPALGLRLHIGEVERERKLMSAPRFAAERLGWWGDPKNSRTAAFGAGKWESCALEADPGPAVDAIAVSVSMDRKHSSIGAAGAIRVDETDRLLVGAVDRREGTGWLVPEAWRIHKERGVPVVVARSAADLIPAFEAVGFVAGQSLIIARAGDAQDACAGIFDRVQQGVLAHANHPDLDESVYGAHRRDTNGRWVWDRKNSETDVSMLEAVTLAAWQASLTKIDSQPWEAWT